MIRHAASTVALLLAAGCQRHDGDVLGPIIVRTEASYELVLPRAIADAVQRAVPGFEVETMSAYDADVQRYYENTSRQVPWAVVADFNADGAQDVVVDGHVGNVFRRLVVWGGSAAVDTTFESLRRQHGERFGTVLQYSPPGEDFSWETETSVFVFVDGFVDYHFEKAGVTYYWEDGQWKSYASSD